MQNIKQLVPSLIKRNSLQMTCSFFLSKEKKETSDSRTIQLVFMCVLILFQVN